MDSSIRPRERPTVEISADDVEKIERVVWAEARGEGVEGRDAVRGVIFNRLGSSRFPNDVDGVLGREFEPVRTYGDALSIPITDEELQQGHNEFADYYQIGNDAVGGRTFFQNVATTESRGTDFSGPDPLVIGRHTFTRGYEDQEPVIDTSFSHNISVTYPDEETMVVQNFRRGGQPDERGRKGRRKEFLRSIQGYSDRVEDEKNEAISEQDQSVEEVSRSVEDKRKDVAVDDTLGIKDKQTRKPVSEAALKQTDEIIQTPKELSDRRRVQTNKLPAMEDAIPAQNPKTPAQQDIQLAKSQKLPEAISMNHGGLAMGIMAPDVVTGFDPVSGNPIPLGSTAENVRDDIPAALSEGEYVAPADVVRWHGLKTYVEMQQEAKMGLMAMASIGQIKGLEEDGNYGESTCPICGGYEGECEACNGMGGHHSEDEYSDDGDLGEGYETAEVTVVEEEYPMKEDSEGIKAYPSEEVGQSFTVGDEQVLLVFNTPSKPYGM
jgi:hypothetical protein